MSCPTIDSLQCEENQAHVQGCPACRSVFAMQSLRRPNPDSCEDVDDLMGLLGALTTPDSQRLHEHLAECPACMVTYLTLVEDEAASTTISPPWKGPSMENVHEPRLLVNHKALVGGLSFVVVALLVVLLARQKNEPTEIAAGSTEQASEAVTPPTLPGEPAPILEVTPAETTKRGASRPVSPPPVAPIVAKPKSPAQVLLSGRGAELAGLTEAALSENRIADALGHCSEATKNAPVDDATSYVCALANCTKDREQSTYERLVGRIKSPTLKGQADLLCAEQHTGWAIDVSCDEVTCLVTPDAPCCVAKKERARAVPSPEKRPESRPANEAKPKVSVEDMVKKASDLVRVRRYTKGLELCEAALEIDAKHHQARMVCGIAACNLGMAKRAKRHIGHIWTMLARRASSRCVFARA